MVGKADSKRIAQPDGSTNTYNYDTLNRLATLTNSLTGQFGFGYDALSRRTQLTRPNGVNTNYTYDSVSRLLSVLHQAGASTLDGASYGYDLAGNRTSKTNYLNSITEGYSYDLIYQLTQVTQGGSTTESYSYDAVGNRLSSLSSPSYSYNASNQLTSNSNGSFTYDANGNTLSDAQGRSFIWDFENRLTQVVNPGVGTTTFRYDPFGRRIQKSGPLGTTNYVYDADNLVEEFDQSGSALARYTQTLLIDEPLAELRSGATTYYEADGINSITSLTNSTSTIAGTYAYDTFGSLSTSTGSITNPFRYTGREFDPESGLYFYRARHFDANTGRFLSEDPLGTGSDDLNGYRYVGNNPVKFMDPWGLCRIHFNGSQIMIETNNGTQRLGPFPASNSTICNCGMPHGVFPFDMPHWMFQDGQETALGKKPFDSRDHYQAFGSARIPIDVPGRSGIMIHAKHPDSTGLSKTKGCIRVHDAVAVAFSRFIDAVCGSDGPNTVHYFDSSF